MDKVVHFEIPCDNREKISEFYSKVFQWNMSVVPNMNYTMAITGETDENNMPLEKGHISGGLFDREDSPFKAPMITINVENIEDSLKKVVEAGGEVVKERITVGDMGAVAYFKDVEGNINGIWENAKNE